MMGGEGINENYDAWETEIFSRKYMNVKAHIIAGQRNAFELLSLLYVCTTYSLIVLLHLYYFKLALGYFHKEISDYAPQIPFKIEIQIENRNIKLKLMRVDGCWGFMSSKKHPYRFFRNYYLDLWKRLADIIELFNTPCP